MLKVDVTNRNQGIPCGRCGKPIGKVGKHAYVTHRARGRRGSYCEVCGEKLLDSTVKQHD